MGRGLDPQLRELDPDERLDWLEREITERIKEFEITALVDLLAAIGYGPEQLEFCSHVSFGPQPTLLHAIEFPARYGDLDEDPRVRITVNLGLLSCRSPLPNYFLEYMRSVDHLGPFLELLRGLDTSLLLARLCSDRPERVTTTWPGTVADLLRCAGLASPIGLQWLCRQVFPELGVLVRRVEDQREVPAIGARLDGVSKLGECSFGKRTRVGVHELELVLICEDASYDEARSWVMVGKQRLRDHVFPLLDEVCVTLTTSFVLLDRGTRARLSDAPPSYMGYDPMWDSDELPLDPPSRIELYRGVLPRDEPSTAELERALAEDTSLSLELDSSASVDEDPTRLGCRVRLPLRLSGPGMRYRYFADIEWGARAWYRDEPHAIRLTAGDPSEQDAWVPKPRVSAAQHPRLWAKLRDAASLQLGQRVASHVRGGRPVTSELVEELIAAQDFEGLHALASSRVAPLEDWDEDAWRRFSAWMS